MKIIDRCPGAVEEKRPAIVEQVQEKVTSCVMHLKLMHADSMSVVLTPDGQIELSLRLQAQEGGVDVQAQVRRGDRGNLTAHWGQLQQNLSAQGIRLNALQEAPLSSWRGCWRPRTRS